MTSCGIHTRGLSGSGYHMHPDPDIQVLRDLASLVSYKYAPRREHRAKQRKLIRMGIRIRIARSADENCGGATSLVA